MNDTVKKILPAAAAVAAAAGTLCFLTAPGRAGKAQKKPFMYKNFAHRGLHKKDKTIPENSLAYGVPCRVVREVTDEGSLENKPELF